MSAHQAALLVAFGLCSFLALAGALGMATTMSMFRSGIFLMTSFIGVAGLFILLAADLMGLLQIMMYVGGMLIMIMFMVLFMHDPGGAMMAGMPDMMAPIERFFSKGLQPQPDRDEETAHDTVNQDEVAPGRMSDGNTVDCDNTTGAMDHATLDHVRMDHTGMKRGAGHDHAGVMEGSGPVKHMDMPKEQDAHVAVGSEDCHGMVNTGMAHDSAKGNDMDKMGDMGNMGDMGDMSMVTPVRALAVWGATAVGIGLVLLLLLRPAWPVVRQHPDANSALAVGMMLMHKYMIAFEGAGFLILLGIFGAVFLARTERHVKAADRAARVARAEDPPPAESGPAPERHVDLP
jgi:NADH-quinone oxidoreductase subunit J